MTKEHKQIAVRGRTVAVPSAQVDGRTVIVTGRFVRIASIHDAALAEGEIVPSPAEFIAKLAVSGLRADILTFSQKIHDQTPRHSYPFEWDNAAVACTSNYTAWWEALPQVVRKNVRRAAKRGVSVEVVPFDEALVR